MKALLMISGYEINTRRDQSEAGTINILINESWFLMHKHLPSWMRTIRRGEEGLKSSLKGSNLSFKEVSSTRRSIRPPLWPINEVFMEDFSVNTLVEKAGAVVRENHSKTCVNDSSMEYFMALLPPTTRGSVFCPASPPLQPTFSRSPPVSSCCVPPTHVLLGLFGGTWALLPGVIKRAVSPHSSLLQPLLGPSPVITTHQSVTASKQKKPGCIQDVHAGTLSSAHVNQVHSETSLVRLL